MAGIVFSSIQTVILYLACEAVRQTLLTLSLILSSPVFKVGIKILSFVSTEIIQWYLDIWHYILSLHGENIYHWLCLLQMCVTPHLVQKILICLKFLGFFATLLTTLFFHWLHLPCHDEQGWIWILAIYLYVSCISIQYIAYNVHIFEMICLLWLYKLFRLIYTYDTKSHILHSGMIAPVPVK